MPRAKSSASVASDSESPSTASEFGTSSAKRSTPAASCLRPPPSPEFIAGSPASELGTLVNCFPLYHVAPLQGRRGFQARPATVVLHVASKYAKLRSRRRSRLRRRRAEAKRKAKQRESAAVGDLYWSLMDEEWAEKRQRRKAAQVKTWEEIQEEESWERRKMEWVTRELESESFEAPVREVDGGGGVENGLESSVSRDKTEPVKGESEEELALGQHSQSEVRRAEQGRKGLSGRRKMAPQRSTSLTSLNTTMAASKGEQTADSAQLKSVEVERAPRLRNGWVEQNRWSFNMLDLSSRKEIRAAVHGRALEGPSVKNASSQPGANGRYGSALSKSIGGRGSNSGKSKMPRIEEDSKGRKTMGRARSATAHEDAAVKEGVQRANDSKEEGSPPTAKPKAEKSSRSEREAKGRGEGRSLTDRESAARKAEANLGTAFSSELTGSSRALSAEEREAVKRLRRTRSEGADRDSFFGKLQAHWRPFGPLGEDAQATPKAPGSQAGSRWVCIPRTESIDEGRRVAEGMQKGQKGKALGEGKASDQGRREAAGRATAVVEGYDLREGRKGRHKILKAQSITEGSSTSLRASVPAVDAFSLHEEHMTQVHDKRDDTDELREQADSNGIEGRQDKKKGKPSKRQATGPAEIQQDELGKGSRATSAVAGSKQVGPANIEESPSNHLASSTEVVSSRIPNNRSGSSPSVARERNSGNVQKKKHKKKAKAMSKSKAKARKGSTGSSSSIGTNGTNSWSGDQGSSLRLGSSKKLMPLDRIVEVSGEGQEPPTPTGLTPKDLQVGVQGRLGFSLDRSAIRGTSASQDGELASGVHLRSASGTGLGHSQGDGEQLPSDLHRSNSAPLVAVTKPVASEGKRDIGSQSAKKEHLPPLHEKQRYQHVPKNEKPSQVKRRPLEGTGAAKDRGASGVKDTGGTSSTKRVVEYLSWFTTAPFWRDQGKLQSVGEGKPKERGEGAKTIDLGYVKGQKSKQARPMRRAVSLETPKR